MTILELIDRLQHIQAANYEQNIAVMNEVDVSLSFGSIGQRMKPEDMRICMDLDELGPFISYSLKGGL